MTESRTGWWRRPGDDPGGRLMGNLDTDIAPPATALAATRRALGEDDADTWLPFTGRDGLQEAVAAYSSLAEACRQK